MAASQVVCGGTCLVAIYRHCGGGRGGGARADGLCGWMLGGPTATCTHSSTPYHSRLLVYYYLSPFLLDSASRSTTTIITTSLHSSSSLDSILIHHSGLILDFFFFFLLPPFSPAPRQILDSPPHWYWSPPPIVQQPLDSIHSRTQSSAFPLKQTVPSFSASPRPCPPTTTTLV